MVGHSGFGMVQRLHSLLAKGEAAEQGDADLLRRFAGQGDAAAFAAIVHRHGPMVLGVCRRLLHNSADADDAFQATFAVLIRKAASLSRPERLAGWLFQVAYRTARRGSFNAPAPEKPRVAFARCAGRGTDRGSHLARDAGDLRRRSQSLAGKAAPAGSALLHGRANQASCGFSAWLARWNTFQPTATMRRVTACQTLRRGVTVSSTALSLALVQGMASAAVPVSLATATIQSASLITAGSAMAGPVAVLTQGVLQSMFMTKLKIVAVLTLTVGILGGGTGWVLQGTGHGDGAYAEQPGGNRSAEKAKSTDTTSRLEFAAIKWELVREELSDLKKQQAAEKLALEKDIERANKLAAGVEKAQAAFDAAQADLLRLRKQAAEEPAPAVPEAEGRRNSIRPDRPSSSSRCA